MGRGESGPLLTTSPVARRLSFRMIMLHALPRPPSQNDAENSSSPLTALEDQGWPSSRYLGDHGGYRFGDRGSVSVVLG
jgi:hypothetical protein